MDTDVRVTVWFWVSVAVLCPAVQTGAVLVWVAVAFASVVLHEFGHVYALRRFGGNGEIALYLWGAMTEPFHRLRRPGQEVMVALAGPLTGLALAAAVLMAAGLMGATIAAGRWLIVPVIAIAPPGATSMADAGGSLTYQLLNDLVQINLYWALINLMPVFPFDGANAAKALLERSGGSGVRRKALMLSAAAAALLAILGAVGRSLHMLLPFAVLAVSSAAALESERPGGPAPMKRWR